MWILTFTVILVLNINVNDGQLNYGKLTLYGGRFVIHTLGMSVGVCVCVWGGGGFG